MNIIPSWILKPTLAHVFYIPGTTSNLGTGKTYGDVNPLGGALIIIFLIVKGVSP